MRIRSTRWKVEELKSGSYNIIDKRRTVKFDVSIDEALRYVRKNMESGDGVALVENDGYATDITRRLLRRR